MRPYYSVSRLYKATFRTRPACSLARRCLHSEVTGKKMGEPYNVSELVLQLDSYESPYVKTPEQSGNKEGQRRQETDLNDDMRTNDSKAGAVHCQIVAGTQHLEVESIEDTQTKTIYDLLNQDESRRFKLGIYTPTISDYLTFALSDFQYWYKLDSNMYDVFYWNWITDNVKNLRDPENYNAALQELQDVVHEKTHWDLSSIFISNDRRFRQNVLMSATRISELSRLTALICLTREGAEALASSGEHVMEGVTEIRRNDSVSALKTLRFVTALTANLESKGVEMGPHLCSLGIHYAGIAGIYSSLNHYIATAIERDYPTTLKTILSLVRTINRIIHSRKPSPAIPQVLDISYSTSSRIQVLSLLTGWEAGGVPDKNEVRKPCFARLVRGSHAMYMRYISGLGYMGASEALWYEWTHPEITPMPPLPARHLGRPDFFLSEASAATETEDEPTTLRHRIEMFSDALIRAKDLRRARIVLETTQEPGFVYSEESLKQHDLMKIAILKSYDLEGRKESDPSQINSAAKRLLLWNDEIGEEVGNGEIDKTVPNVERLLGVTWVEAEENGKEGFHVEVESV